MYYEEPLYTFSSSLETRCREFLVAALKGHYKRDAINLGVDKAVLTIARRARKAELSCPAVNPYYHQKAVRPRRHNGFCRRSQTAILD